MSSITTDQILASTEIHGVDIMEALGRMGNNSKIFMRIIHSFTTNMPGNLAELATDTITADTLKDYSIRIHGAKGSCYGIGANAMGDVALALEMAAKAGDLETCLRDNDSFITGTQELLVELEALEARVEQLESDGGGKAQADKPDAAKLRALLTATQQFDIDEMGKLVEELAGIQYAQGSEIISRIKNANDAFDYLTVEETIAAYLKENSY